MRVIKIATGGAVGLLFGLWMAWLDVNLLQCVAGYVLMITLLSVGAWAVWD
ncbi:hypothetical protein KTE49_20550 [Burkholderia multivorans]|uniref:Uncharacterized protein n=1 Tax=Burkholderia multivorans CGD2 TaxID=513052 RepID=B9BQI9_9BURK|nr:MULTISPECIES: hypothetical protein [Burkholderia cepacia complex]EEE06884.1 hypothetical protein BURMUCGD2_1180 [Burkholderia multivorans CGD2]EEE13172.1 hypothetical protein BURMUCGD2M_1271 [Burkholderia multivorans CGD2M]MBU9532828.1 hypothetical protein [Burkholderia multivorans]MBU9549912.1 hypothetical protein [Burkholderia multivorans]MBY4752014.1 hypothetical protein [Burkholderia dolosa]